MGNEKDLFSLAGKKALVIGGTGGLGNAIAHAFLQKGADVAIGGQRIERIEAEFAEEAAVSERDYLGVEVDVMENASISEMTAAVIERFERIDILVNAAGISVLQNVEAHDKETVDRVMEMNVKGTHLVTMAVGRRMIDQNYGRIINLSSVKGMPDAGPDYVAYCIAKGAVSQYTKQLAVKWAKYGITCNAIAPILKRPKKGAEAEENKNSFEKLAVRIPAGRIATYEDTVCAALYLASDAAATITGRILGVDGVLAGAR